MQEKLENIFRKLEIKIIVPRNKCTFNQVQMFTVFVLEFMNEWIQKARNVSDSNHQTSSTRCYDNNQSRLARQDLLRRRDINLYTGGLHPRLLHGQQPQISPRLSLFSNNQNTPETQPPSRTTISGPGPCRAFPASVTNNTPQMPSPASFLQSPCSPPPSYEVMIKF